jgi:glycosyltransferase involved in cell wall biosynthesis
MGWFPKVAGGLDRYVYELTHQLAANRDQIELCGIDLPESLPNSPLRLINLASSESSLLQRLWNSHLKFSDGFSNERSLQFNAINIHFALYGLPLLRSLPKDIPVTFTFHGPWALESAQEGTSKLSVLMKYWVEQQVFQGCDRFIVLSQAFGKILHQHYRIPWDKIYMIPGGVNLRQFQPDRSRLQARQKLGWPQDRMILFTPRRLVHRMGLNQLLTAVDKLRARIPEIWLAIAGKGPIRPLLEQQIMELELGDHVKLLGFLPDEQLPLAYQAADLTVIPSQALEGFGLVLLESLACGTPAMCTPVGGMPEVLAPLSPSLIARSPTAPHIAESLEELLLGQVSLPSREDCREYVATHFGWPTIAQQVRQVLLA